jgi:hypothetical protein
MPLNTKTKKSPKYLILIKKLKTPPGRRVFKNKFLSKYFYKTQNILHLMYIKPTYGKSTYYYL